MIKVVAPNVAQRVIDRAMQVATLQACTYFHAAAALMTANFVPLGSRGSRSFG